MVTVEGTFDVERFYQTLANIIGNREGVRITATVRVKPPPEKPPKVGTEWKES